jgi:aquaporin Z
MYAIGPVSGCHVNPAVTLGLCVAGKITPKDAAGYVVAQCVGAIAAAAMIFVIADSGPFGYLASVRGLGSNGYGAHSPAGFGLGGAFLAEVLLTGLLVFTVLGATHLDAPVGFAGIAVGFVLTVGNLVAIPVDNASINPARSLGPAALAGGWAMGQLWMFLVAPVVGGLLAAALHRALRPEPSVAGADRPPTASEARIALETARLLRLPVGAPDLAPASHAPNDGDRYAPVGAERSAAAPPTPDRPPRAYPDEPLAPGALMNPARGYRDPAPRDMGGPSRR